MPNYRMDRVTEDIKRELSDILRDLKDPRITGLVSIIRVELTQDLSYAKVYISVVGGDLEGAMEGLKSASGFVRRELSSRIHIRKTPELKFIADTSIEHSAKINRMLNDIKNKEV